MKNIFKITFLFIGLSIALSSFSACTGTATSTQTNSAGETTPNVEKSKSSSGVSLPAAISQAEIKNIDGSTFKVEDKKGKVLLLNLWATWCGPCRAEMPELVELQDKYRDKDFEIIGLNTDNESVELIKDFADDLKLNYTLAWSDEKLRDELLKISKFPGIPQSYLIDREGQLRGVFTGGGPKVVDQLKETSEKVINE